MPGTWVEYNDVWIKDCETTQFTQEIIYDESRTDTIHSRFRIRVLGSVHPDQLQGHGTQFGSGELPGPAANLVQLLQARLSHPRGIFKFVVDDTVLIKAVPIPATPDSDVDNGPKPLYVDITRIVGSRLYRVEFEIECCLIKCFEQSPGTNLQNWPPQNTQANPYVVSNRWSVSEERDANFFATRVIEGLLRVSHAWYCPHMFRWLCVPKLQRGYRREMQRYWDSADGMTLRYQIVDKQKFASPPTPAVDWYATYTESSGEGGAIGFGDMRIILDGAPNCDKQQLLQAAVNILLERMRGLQMAPSSPDYCHLLGLTIVEHLHAPRIELSAQVRHSSADKEEYLAARIGRIRRGLDGEAFADYDPDVWAVPNPYSTNEVSGLWAHYWQDPCYPTHGIIDPVQPPPQNEDDEENKRDHRDYTLPEIFPAPAPPYPPDVDLQVDQKQAIVPYTYYLAECEYKTDNLTVALPRASWTDRAKGPKDTQVLARLGQGATTLTIKVHAERIGVWPYLGAPKEYFSDSSGQQYHLLGYRMFPATPKLTADGRSKLYRLQVHYDYALTRKVATTDTIYIPQDPRILPVALDTALNLREIFTDPDWTGGKA